jgi:protein-glutamine gamma-glutamyltransferase
MSRLRVLHRRFAAAMSLTAIAAFISGAGFEAPAAFVAALVLAVAAVRQPGEALAHRLEPIWRVVALLLIARALYFIVFVPMDVVVPMVDLLLLLLCAEAMRPLDSTSDARLYSLSCALFVAASAYRPGVGFALAFVAFLALGCIALVVGHLARQSAQWGVTDIRPDRGLILRVSALSSVMLASALIVFFAFPRVSTGWMARGIGVEHSIIGFSDQVSLGAHGSQLHGNPAVALRVEFPAGRPPGPLYWRGRSYDRFDGVRWSRGYVMDAAPRIDAGDALVEQRIYATPLPVPVLFGLPTIAAIEPRSRIAPMRDMAGDFIYSGGGMPAYTVLSSRAAPDPEQLRASRHSYPLHLRPYLQLPPVSERLLLLADSLREGHANVYDRVLAVQRYFHEEFRYTLRLPRTEAEATLEHFLFERRAGHCEYFSTAMVMLLRAQGIPARNVNGFLGGDWNEFGGYMTVTQNQAHSWVEVWFPSHGWVTFDPTPSALADVAAANRSWLFSFRLFGDGLQHRWGKWVLDFDGGRQADLLQRTSNSLTQPAGPGGRTGLLVRVLAWGAGLLLLLFIAHRWRRALARRSRVAPEIRAYERLRDAYASAGVPVTASTPPLAFASTLREARPPGADAALRAIEMYVERRFGARGTTDPRPLTAAVQDAVTALRRHR